MQTYAHDAILCTNDAHDALDYLLSMFYKFWVVTLYTVASGIVAVLDDYAFLPDLGGSGVE